MSLDTVADDIKRQAKARAEEIREDAQQDAEEIREDARQEAAEIHERRLDDAEQTIEQERERERSNAALEAKQRRLETRREHLNRVLETVETELAELDGDRRRELTQGLLADAAEEIDETPATVYGRGDDESLLTELVDEYNGFEYVGEYDCLGGVVVESEASQVRIRNTFDSALEDVWGDSLGEVSDRLFEER